MQNDKEAQKIRVKKVLVNFQRGAPPETAGVDIEKCVNDEYDFFGNRRAQFVTIFGEGACESWTFAPHRRRALSARGKDLPIYAALRFCSRNVSRSAQRQHSWCSAGQV
jgi:hypothetical protein